MHPPPPLPATATAATPTNRLYVFNAEQWAKLHRATRRCQELIEQIARARDIPSELWDALDNAHEVSDAEESARILASMPETRAEDQGDLAASNDLLEFDVGEASLSQAATQEFPGTTEEFAYAMFGGRDLVEPDVWTGGESMEPIRSLLRGSLSQRMDDMYNQV